MTVVAEIVHHVARTTFENLEPRTIASAKERVADTVGCILAGRNAAGCDAVVAVVREAGGNPEATVIGHGVRVPVQEAAFANAVMARSYDFEPVGALVEGKSVPAHISGTTVPTALAMAEKLGVSGREMLGALVLGDDVAARLSAASLFDLDLGWDNTGTVNAFGATVVAGKLLGLTEEQMTNAFGIVLNQLGGTLQNIFDGAQSFKLPQGLAARAGILSAMLAHRGVTGPKDALTGLHGYFARYCRNYDVDLLTRDLGRAYCADETFKPYPCCRANHGSIDCVLSLAREHGLTAADVEEVLVSVRATSKGFAVGQEFQIGETPQISAAFSLQYTVATALLKGSVELSHFSEEAIRDPEIQSLVKRVRLVGDLPPDNLLGAEVSVKMKDGRQYRTSVRHPSGSDAFSPLSLDQKRKKFVNCATFSGGRDASEAEAMLQTLETLDESPSLTETVQALFPLS